MSVTALAHPCICTRDLEATKRFYCDCMGLKKVFDFRKNGKVTGFYLSISRNNYLEFFLDDKAYGNDSPMRHLCFETDDIQALKKQMADKGVKCGEISKGGDQTWQFWTADPNGIPVEFHQYTADSSQFNGREVAMTW